MQTNINHNHCWPQNIRFETCCGDVAGPSTNISITTANEIKNNTKISKQKSNKPNAEARAEIIGPQVKYLTPGSTLRLICRIVEHAEATAFIFWYHDSRMINYDVDRGINVSTKAGMFRLLYV